MSKSVVVIGAGVAGLTTAIRLQKDGYDVTIYEAMNAVGGKMSQIDKGGFKFDVGPTIVMMPHVYQEVFDYAEVDYRDYYQIERLDTMYNVTFSDGEAIRATNDLVTLTRDLEERSEKTAEGYLKYLSETYKKYLVAKNGFIEKSFRTPSDFYNLKTLREAMKLKTFDSAHNTIKKFVTDDKIQKLLSFQTLYIGISPYKGPSIYTIIPMIETIYGVWYIKGGMYSYAKALEQLFLDLGGSIRLNSYVDEIVFDGSVAAGIRIKDTVFSYDAVVCNSDFPFAMKHLIPNKKQKGKYTDKKIDRMDYSCSCFLLYLGVDEKIDDLEVHNLYFSQDFDRNLNDIFEGRLPEDPSFYIYSPSQIDDSVAPKGQESLYVLVPVPELSTATFEWNDSVIQNFRTKIFDLMKNVKGLEHLQDHIIVEDLFTPKRFEKEIRAYNGATFGLAPTLMQSNYFRPKNVHPYTKNLYFAGSSVHPGAGVPIAITSGKLVHEELNKDHQ